MRVIIEETAIADTDGLAAWVAKDSPQRARSTVELILKTKPLFQRTAKIVIEARIFNGDRRQPN